MSDNTQIKVKDNGPYVVKGDVEMVDAEGNVFETRKTFSLCRCGHSSNKPFCDGSHKRVEFESEPRAE
ncbi:CDGSH iron-sulfur domain-containing protein [Lentibacillus cibarius]|uniref:CDGSH iron-sulfur domain-containing protein n=1 Tax=Lentibacillus cibarius TaxID=2583219 RepID=A0A5S3QK45_9BACI|nr:CDGSH iron-sulfur domain-containing protein [Lentibacillus cibarius]TMN22198.1 CDGSH iron-sulfur domain-containing protein [Lentibacillus cibarius]